MTDYSKWSDVREELVANVSDEALAEAGAELEAAETGYKLAELRKARGLTQKQVADHMGVTKARVSQIERGDVSTQDVVARYAEALGGRLKQAIHFPTGDIAIVARVALTATPIPVRRPAKKRTTAAKKTPAGA